MWRMLRFLRMIIIFEDRVVPVFGMLKKLEKLTVAEGNKHFAASGNVLLQKADEAIGGGEEGWVAMLVAPALTGKVVLPDDVVKVDGMAFYGSLISSVTIPDGVMVSYGAFGNSKQLTEVIFKGSASPKVPLSWGHRGWKTMSLA